MKKITVPYEVVSLFSPPAAKNANTDFTCSISCCEALAANAPDTAASFLHIILTISILTYDFYGVNRTTVPV